MPARFFTILCEFRGGTYISQVEASDECGAVRAWAALLVRDRPIKGVSTHLAKLTLAKLEIDPPMALSGLTGAWCIMGTYGGSLMLANIVETVAPQSDR